MTPQDHLAQAYHNRTFLGYLDANAPTNFHDWKITITFYISLHLVKAYLAKNRVRYQDNHIGIKVAIDPANPGCQLPFDPIPYQAYEDLLELSYSSRYRWFASEKSFSDLQVLYYNTAKDNLKIIVDYLVKVGFKFSPEKIL